MKYRPELDGLRAIAVIGVILFHMELEYIQGGFVGVDVFFVISGYLITSIILKEYNNSTFTLLNFWLRRIRRILPALSIMILTTLIISNFLLYRNEHKFLGIHALTSMFSIANIQMWLLSNEYWGPRADSLHLLHTWSLSVEEQFYFIYPIMCLFFLKKSQKYLAFITTVSSLLGFILFSYFSPKHPNAAFYLMPSRFWELLIGCSLALYQPAISYFLNRWYKFSIFLTWLGLALILCSFSFITVRNGINWLILFPILGTSIFIACSNHVTSLPINLLSNKLFTFIGKISYSLYLWHWPILLFHNDFRTETSFLFCISLIVVLSILSYYLVEKPFRHNTKLLPLLITLVVTVCFVATLFSIIKIEHDLSKFKQVHWEGPYYDCSKNEYTLDRTTKKRMEGIKVKLRNKNDSFKFVPGGIIKDYANDSPKIIVWGDSHALMWSPVLDQIAKDLNTSIAFFGRDGKAPFIYITEDNKNDLISNHRILHYIRSWKPIVVLSSRWSFFLDKKLLNQTVDLICEHGGKVLLIDQPPELFFGDQNAPILLSEMGINPRSSKVQYLPTAKSHDFQNDTLILNEISEIHPNCHTVNISDIYLDGTNKVKVLDGSEILYIDDDHLSLAGAFYAKTRLSDAIVKLVSNP